MTEAKTIVRLFSRAGPCTTAGLWVRTTAKFYVYRNWRGGDRYDENERKVLREDIGKYSGAHIVPCPSCRDHPKTSHPDGYMD